MHAAFLFAWLAGVGCADAPGDRGASPVLTDLDGDGFDALDDGGTDCDDRDPTINPDAPEVWYDGIDQDCAGDDDFDQDADGLPVDLDCDDTDPAIGIGRDVAVPADYPTIQAAIDGVCDFSTIHVGPGSLTANLRIDKPLTLIGAGSEETTLAGAGRHTVVTATVPLTMSGFTVAGGYTEGSGGGLALAGGTLTDLRVVGNIALGDGGGIDSTGALRVLDTTIVDNHALGEGGGIHADGLDLVRTQVLGNSAEGLGSGVSASDGTFTGGAVSFNLGTAVHDRGDGFLAAGTRFEGNEAVSGASVTSSPAELTDVVVTGNVGPKGAFAGDLLARRTVFSSNVGIDGGGVVQLDGTEVRLEQSIVAGNQGGVRGGEVGAWGALDARGPGTLTLRNVTLAGNRHVGIVLADGDVHISNCVLASHRREAIRVLGSHPPTLRHSVVDVDGYDALGFVSFSPRMPVDTWDLHLHPDSPLVDAGDPAVRDPDGTVSDIGAYGGPGADFAYYTDADGDGMYDGWETAGSLDPTTDDSGSNDDQDLLTAIEEFHRGTRPHVADTDGDGVSDGDEVASGTDPLGWARHTIVVVDITNSWALDSFLAARDGALALFDEHVATGRADDRIGLVIFFGKFGIEYTPSTRLEDAVANDLRYEWELLRPASIGCPNGVKCAPWMPHQYPDETGTDHAMGLRMARTMFSEHAGPGVYRSLVMITDGQPANVGPHELRWEADDDETRWRYEYAEGQATISEIKVDSVAISSALWHDHQVHGWWVSYRHDGLFMQDAVQGDGTFQRTAEASEIPDLMRDVAISIP